MKRLLFILIILNLQSVAQGIGNNLEFIENRGQVVDMEGNLRPDILYVGDGGGAKIYLRKGGVSYVMSEVEGLEEIEELEEEIEHEKNEIEKKKKQEKLAALEANAKLKIHRVDMEFVNANIDAKIRVEEPTQGYFNYYLGHCPEGITGVKAHRKVIYENMYPNIDVVFIPPLQRGIKGDLLEYDFVVKPGGNVEDIRLRYNNNLNDWKDWNNWKNYSNHSNFSNVKGTDGIEVEDGKLKIKTSLGEMIEEIPEVYQIIEGERVAIEATYVLEGNEVKIVIRDYDKSKVLIIDPWITYYGGSNTDYGSGIATDGSGSVLITGRTVSVNFPVTAGVFQTSYATSGDVFVVKLDAGGNQLWATFYGGSGQDYGIGIATDCSGNVLITGKIESTDFPVTGGAFQTSNAGGYDAFVVKLDAGGNQLWATYYGGSAWEQGYGIATDGSSNVLITGKTESTDFPVTGGAFQTSNAGSSDAFVVKFDAAGNQLWATYYGGIGIDRGNGIATDGNGNVVIIGQNFTVKLDVSGNLLWAIGGGGYGIATDGDDNVLITGGNAYVKKFDTAGNQLWATFFGGSGLEEGFGITVDDSDNIFVCGDTYSTDFPFTSGAFQTTKNGPAGSPNEENYMVKFDPNGNQVCGTYLGGNGHDEIFSGGNIAVYGGVVYMTGWTPGDYPVTAGAFQTGYGGGSYDAWIAQLCDDCTLNCSLPSLPPLLQLLVNASVFPDTICQDSCTNLSSSVAGDSCRSYTFSWTSIPPGFTSSAQDTVVCPDITTTYIVTVDDGDTTATASVTVSVEDCDTTDTTKNIFFIPNSFSPNGDGDNDILLVRGSGIKNIKLFIYNRWGEKVFETIPLNPPLQRGTGGFKGWDGTYRKKPLSPAVFAWYAEVEFSDGDRIYRKGNVTLLR